jgi:hypothetical protein
MERARNANWVTIHLQYQSNALRLECLPGIVITEYIIVTDIIVMICVLYCINICVDNLET